MQQPEGFSEKGKEHFVCNLKKSIYGLKQAARVWNLKINDVLLKDGFRRGTADPCLYSKCVDGVWIYVLIYVDDILIASCNEDFVIKIGEQLANEYKVNCLGEITYYLGLQITKSKEGYFCMNQESYIKRIAKRFNLQDAKPSKIPMDPGYFKL